MAASNRPRSTCCSSNRRMGRTPPSTRRVKLPSALRECAANRPLLVILNSFSGSSLHRCKPTSRANSSALQWWRLSTTVGGVEAVSLCLRISRFLNPAPMAVRSLIATSPQGRLLAMTEIPLSPNTHGTKTPLLTSLLITTTNRYSASRSGN